LAGVLGGGTGGGGAKLRTTSGRKGRTESNSKYGKLESQIGDDDDDDEGGG